MKKTDLKVDEFYAIKGYGMRQGMRRVKIIEAGVPGSRSGYGYARKNDHSTVEEYQHDTDEIIEQKRNWRPEAETYTQFDVANRDILRPWAEQAKLNAVARAKRDEEDRTEQAVMDRVKVVTDWLGVPLPDEYRAYGAHRSIMHVEKDTPGTIPLGYRVDAVEIPLELLEEAMKRLETDRTGPLPTLASSP